MQYHPINVLTFRGGIYKAFTDMPYMRETHPLMVEFMDIGKIRELQKSKVPWSRGKVKKKKKKLKGLY